MVSSHLLLDSFWSFFPLTFQFCSILVHLLVRLERLRHILRGQVLTQLRQKMSIVTWMLFVARMEWWLSYILFVCHPNSLDCCHWIKKNFHQPSVFKLFESLNQIASLSLHLCSFGVNSPQLISKVASYVHAGGCSISHSNVHLARLR